MLSVQEAKALVTSILLFKSPKNHPGSLLSTKPRLALSHNQVLPQNIRNRKGGREWEEERGRENEKERQEEGGREKGEKEREDTVKYLSSKGNNIFPHNEIFNRRQESNGKQLKAVKQRVYNYCHQSILHLHWEYTTHLRTKPIRQVFLSFIPLMTAIFLINFTMVLYINSKNYQSLSSLAKHPTRYFVDKSFLK